MKDIIYNWGYMCPSTHMKVIEIVKSVISF